MNLTEHYSTEARELAESNRETRWADEVNDKDDLYDDVRESFRAVKADKAEREDYESARPARDEFRKWHPDKEPDAAVANMMAWDAEYRRDPLGAATRLSNLSGIQAPRSDIKHEAPKQWFEDDLAEEMSSRNDIRRAMREAERNQADRASFEASAPIRQALKERFPHLSYADAMKRAVEHDAHLNKDPIGYPARLAASYGYQVFPESDAAQHSDNSAAIDQGASVVTQALDSGQFPPGFENDLLAVCRDPEFQRTKSGDFHADLERASRIAMGRINAGAQAQRSRAAAVSIKGSGPGAGRAMPSSSGSVYDDVRAAFQVGY